MFWGRQYLPLPVLLETHHLEDEDPAGQGRVGRDPLPQDAEQHRVEGGSCPVQQAGHGLPGPDLRLPDS
eukprot:5046494-Heterocapsa_arctica.AAC.1